MIEKISKNITQILLQTNIISQKESQTFQYCFSTVFLFSLFFICALTIAYILDFLFPSLLFLIVFLILRSVAGGFHASTPEHCFLLSIFTFIIFLGISQVYMNCRLVFVIYIVATINILLTAPVEARNYPLSYTKRQRHQKQCIFFLLIISIVYILLYFYNVPIFAASIFTAVIFTSSTILICH